MAKGKKRNNSASSNADSQRAGGVAVEATTDQAQDAGGRYVGQWNRLISTTNWEKGRIICQWREAMSASGAAASEYSDEAWSQLVGGVTSQHVGRLRRTFERFGAVFDQYEGLYWSHFQAGLDWDDAEMWLEGAIHNRWSVSQMRGKRWETLGTPGEAPPSEVETVDAADESEVAEAAVVAIPPSDASVDRPAEKRGAAAQKKAAGAEAAASDQESEVRDEAASESPRAKTRKRLSVDVDDLPSDLADAFEQFKLAIIAHRRDGWRQTSAETVIECLDALRELALAPADE